MIIKRLIKSGSATLLTLSFLLGGTFAFAESEEPLSVGVNVWVGWMPWWIVDEKDMLKKHGANAELRFFGVQSDSMTALAAGHIDANSLATNDVLSVNASGVPTSIINLTNESAGADMLITRGVEKFEDLKGKQIGVEIGGVSHFFLAKLLDENGMSQDDVQLRNMTAANAGSAFLSGSIDAVVTWEPHATKAVEGGGEILGSSKDTPNAVVDVLAVRNSVLEDRREDLGKVLAAWFDALEFVETNPEEAFSIMAEASDVSVEQMKAMWSGVRMYDRDDVVRIMGTPGDPGLYYETVSDMSEFMIGQELIPKPVAASDVIDASFVRDGMGSN